MYVDKPVFHLDEYETNFELELSVYQDGKPILSRKLSKPVFNFNGWEKGKGGMALLVYNAPQDLPLNKRLKCKLKVVKTDQGFIDKYGQPKFFIRKMSDK